MNGIGRALASVCRIASIGALLGVTACSGGPHRSITLAGSTAFQPFAEKLAEQYMATHSDVQVHVQGGGSAVGIQSALSGAAAIGMADLLQLPDDAKELTSTVVARDGIAIIVSRDNPVTELTAAQTRDVFSGAISNWKEVGGPDATIHVVSREDGSGTRRTFDKLVLSGRRLSPAALFQNSNGTVREAVASDGNAIGYVSIGLVNDRVIALKYEGVDPTNDNVRRGTYVLSRPILLLTKKAPAAPIVEFIDYLLSPEAQRILEQEGLIPVI